MVPCLWHDLVDIINIGTLKLTGLLSNGRQFITFKPDKIVFLFSKKKLNQNTFYLLTPIAPAQQYLSYNLCPR